MVPMPGRPEISEFAGYEPGELVIPGDPGGLSGLEDFDGVLGQRQLGSRGSYS